ncbi:Alpha/Beta hydrolase protein [Xylariales sp. PMI_506]|nr:Alpha/Beta hydrolase protein [Xylariales sp. PMI_506]
MAQPGSSHTGNALTPLPLPSSIRSSYVDCTDSCGLVFHILESSPPAAKSSGTAAVAGAGAANRRGTKAPPLVLFCHGYPELAFSWRKILPRIAAAGYYCVAMDQRGYGRTTSGPAGGGAEDPRQSSPSSYSNTDLRDYAFTNLVRDLVCLVHALGYTEVHSIIGHDFGAALSAAASLIRPDVFLSTAQLSTPHSAPPVPALAPAPALSGGTKPPPLVSSAVDIQAELAKLDPPRKHYKWYNSTPAAAGDWDHPPQGLEAFLRGYFYLKSAGWAGNAPRRLARWAAADLAVMPEYYIMRADRTMPETVADNLATVGEGVAGEEEEDYATRTERWLGREELSVYCAEWSRTGFQGGLNWYRAQTSPPRSSTRGSAASDMLLFAGRRIEVPCVYISGRQDWANYQQPGALEGYDDPKVVREGCFRGRKLIDGAGHWVQQEQPEAVIREILAFFDTL